MALQNESRQANRKSDRGKPIKNRTTTGNRPIDQIMAAVIAALMVTMISPREAIAAPAKPISSYQIYAVASKQYRNYQWDYVKESDVITPNDHGGPDIYVAVKQTGYGLSRIATLNTFAMTLVDTQNILDSNRNIVGYYYIFQLKKGVDSGSVTTKATSGQSHLIVGTIRKGFPKSTGLTECLRDRFPHGGCCDVWKPD